MKIIWKFQIFLLYLYCESSLKEILRVVLRYVGVSEINAGALLTGIRRRKLNHDQWAVLMGTHLMRNHYDNTLTLVRML